MTRYLPNSSGLADIAKVEEVFPSLNIDGVKYEVKEVLSKGSANMIPEDWIKIARVVESSIKSNVDRIVLLHGTDTMQYTAAALSFMLAGLPVPVVMTGSMIPMGDPQTDGVSNLNSAVMVAAFADLAEVCVLFSSAEKSKVIIRGTRAKKINSHERQAFASINREPLGYCLGDKIELVDWRVKRSDDARLEVRTSLNRNVSLIKVHPALTNEQLDRFLNPCAGAVLEGSGIGHFRVDDGFPEVIERFGRPTALTTQCLYGGEKLGMYAMDRDILSISNIIPVRDMLPEVALVKMMWCLPQNEVKKLMLTNIAGEMT